MLHLGLSRNNKGFCMCHILVVDDSLFQRRFIRKLLEGLGHVVMEATNGVEALEVLAHHHFDFMTTDLMMPQMGGLDLLKSLQEQGVQLPTLVISSDGKKETEKKVIHLGAIALIEKPIEGQEEKIHQFIQSHMPVAS